MAYINQDSDNIIEDLLHRKEFYWLKRWDNEKSVIADIIPRFLLDDAIRHSMNLTLSSYQQFVQNYMNPSTPYKRLLMKWDTGTGKTIGLLSIAMNFINYYRLERDVGNVEIGSVFIMGFSERVFKNELLRFPEFKFISRNERYKLDKLKRLAANGSTFDVNKYQENLTRIKKRFSNRKGNGFFKFYGYKAFVNRIFIPDSGVNLNELSEEQIREYIKDGRIKYDDEILAQFKNSIIMCDEIHNVYNSVEKNNWGVAIQAVLDKVPTCRAVFASATPLNNSPAEIIDLLNLLLPVEQRLTKSLFFTSDLKLKPHALEQIAALSRGRVSYVRDVNPKYYPTVSFVGEQLNQIPYLKFKRCVMSDFHYKTYLQAYHGALSQDSQYLVDFAIENPEDKNIGIYSTNTIKTIASAPQSWKDKYMLDFTHGKITGDALIKKSLSKYSTKYVAMLDEIDNVVKEKRGKIFIYHNIVHMSGVLFIEQVLLRNGIIDEFSNSTDSTLCMVCGLPRSKHTDIKLGARHMLAQYVEVDDNAAADNAVADGKVNDIVDDIVDNKADDIVDDIVDNKADDIVDNKADDIVDDIVDDKADDKVVDDKADDKVVDDNDANGTIGSGEHQDCINIVDEAKYIKWIKHEEHMLLLKKHKNELHVAAGSISHRLIKGESHALRDLSIMLDEYSDFPIYFQIPKYAARLGEWLIHMGFKLYKQRNKYFTLKWNGSKTSIGGGVNGTSMGGQVGGGQIGGASMGGQVGGASMGGQVGGTSISTKNKFYKKHTKLHNTKSKKPIIKKYKLAVKQAGHKFIPMRFIIVHGEIDKAQMQHSIDRFNAVENSTGEQYMILVGSKIIKESYDLKAIQNIFIMGKPDNIPTLIQIRGRAVRKNSHKYLPHDKRHVSVYIFTSCLQSKIKDGIDKNKYSLSYEEDKYKEKIASFQIIQSIERVLHENAIDSFVRYDEDKQIVQNDPLGALPFKPAGISFNKEFSITELNTKTFDIYHAEQEVNLLKLIIKRLFIEISPVWTYDDLFDAVHNPLDYESEINTHLFTSDHFIIALKQLTYLHEKKWVEPIINKVQLIEEYDASTIANTHIVTDRLFDSDDKIIALPSGQNSMIVQMVGDETYYMLFPIDPATSEPNIDIESLYRISKQSVATTINMNHFIQTKRLDFDYDDKKRIFYHRYVDIAIENMENVVCEYGTIFHVKFLEECIEYIFRAWTDPTIVKSDMHEFYFKMLYYYDLLSLVLWAYTAKPRIFRDYIKYAIPVKAKDIKLKTMSLYEKRKEELEDISPDDTSDLATSGVINLLKSSLNRTSNAWIPQEFREQYDKTVAKSLSLFINKKKKSKSITKVSGDLLPIGHFIGKFPRIYNPDSGWTEDPTYKQSDQTYIENDTIIGYDSRSAAGVHIRFKMRNPIHNIKKQKDSRLIERGVVCKSKSKGDLKRIAKSIDVTLPDNRISVEELCRLIRSKLIRLELKERIKKSKIKWFYFHYEDQSFDL